MCLLFIIFTGAGVARVVRVGNDVVARQAVIAILNRARKTATRRVCLVGEAQLIALRYGCIQEGVEAAEIADAYFRCAALGYNGGLRQVVRSTCADISAQIGAYEFVGPFGFARSAFVACVAEARAIHARTVGTAVDVFTRVDIAGRRESHQHAEKG